MRRHAGHRQLTRRLRQRIAHLIHPSSLLDLICELFEAVWARSGLLNQSEPENGQAMLSRRDRQLLGLLANDATDSSIARTFGWSTRTVQRHVQQLMEQVGAQTRFQIGMEAVRRGWI